MMLGHLDYSLWQDRVIFKKSLTESIYLNFQKSSSVSLASKGHKVLCPLNTLLWHHLLSTILIILVCSNIVYSTSVFSNLVCVLQYSLEEVPDPLQSTLV